MTELNVQTYFRFNPNESQLLRDALNPFQVLVEQCSVVTDAADLAALYQRRINSAADELRPHHLSEYVALLADLKGALLVDGERWDQEATSAPEVDGGMIAKPQEVFRVLASTRQTQTHACDEALKLVQQTMSVVCQLDDACQQLVGECDEEGE